MESGEIRMRFGRCPYCRTMVYQNPQAAVFFCSKCRTPIRGKNPLPTEGIDQALSGLEILSVDKASVFSDELDACRNKLAPGPGVDIHGDQRLLFHRDTIAPPRSSSPAPAPAPAPDGGFGSVRRGRPLNSGAPTGGAGGDDGVDVDSNEQDSLRPFSRRTRRSSGSDPSVLRYGRMLMTADSEMEEGFSSPRNACERHRHRHRHWHRRRRSQAFETSIGSSGQQEPYGVAPSPLRDPSFHNELANALDNLRGLVAAIEPASSSSSRRASAPRDAHSFRRLESQLARALHVDGRGGHRRNASSAVSSSSSCSYRGERRKNHCRPVLGGAPFLVCGSCSELLQAPAATGLPRGKVVRLRCGGCEEVLEMTEVPAGVGGSATHKKTWALSPAPVSDPSSCNGSAGGDIAQHLPLHRALGYSSPSPLLQSRRY